MLHQCHIKSHKFATIPKEFRYVLMNGWPFIGGSDSVSMNGWPFVGGHYILCVLLGGVWVFGCSVMVRSKDSHISLAANEMTP